MIHRPNLLGALTLGAAIGLPLLSVTSLRAQFVPIALGADSYNHDIVIEAAAPAPPEAASISASMDGGTAKTGFTWHEVGYLTNAPATGLPPAGSTITNISTGTHIYTFAPSYAVKNTILIDLEHSASFTIPGSAVYRALSFLTAAANGDVSVAYTINYFDGGTQEGTFTSADWFNGANPAYAANGRVAAQSGAPDSVGTDNPRLYSVDIMVTNTGPVISSVSLKFNSGPDAGHAAIFAVSGLLGEPRFEDIAPSVTVFAGQDAVLRQKVVGAPPLIPQWSFLSNGLALPIPAPPRTPDSFLESSITFELPLRRVSFAQAGRYALSVSNMFGSTGQNVVLTVLSNGSDVTRPTDIIASIGGTSPTGHEARLAIDNTTSQFTGNFVRPPGTAVPFTLSITPTRPSSVVTGLRIYSANDSPEHDPSNYALEGVNGGQPTIIAFGLVDMPEERNPSGLSLDPIHQHLQEIRFQNTTAYQSYRLSFLLVRDDGNIVQVGEIELLEQGDDRPRLTIDHIREQTISAFKIASSQTGNLEFTAALAGTNTVWTNLSQIIASSPLIDRKTGKSGFYRVTVP